MELPVIAACTYSPVAKWDFWPEPQKFLGKPFYCIFFIDMMVLIKNQEGVEV